MIKIGFQGTLDKEGFLRELYRECPELRNRKIKFLVEDGKDYVQIWFIEGQVDSEVESILRKHLEETKMAEKGEKQQPGGFLVSMNFAMEQLYQEIQDRIAELAKLAETAQSQIKTTVAQVSETAKAQIDATTKEIKVYTKDHSAHTEARMKNLEDSLAAQIATLAGRITVLDDTTRTVFAKVLARLEAIEKKLAAASQALKE